MNNVRFVVLLGSLAIAGIISFELYWFARVWNAQERQFNQSVMISLGNVANRIFEYYNIAPANVNPVNQVNKGYYVVNTNTEIDANILEYYLIREFDLHNIRIDFEYAIYNCSDDKMVYGNYISHRGEEQAKRSDLPKYDKFVYYFGVNFPSRTGYILKQLTIWIAFSAILIVFIIFFAYSIFIILKQKRLSDLQKDFINNMTHEFKTPIASISLSTEVLLDPAICQKPERLKLYAGLIKQENERLNRQVEKVLGMARIDRSGFTLEKEKINPHEIISKIAESFKLNFPDIRISCQLIKGNIRIHADSVHFGNVIFNLLDNAVKYSGTNPEIMIRSEIQKNRLIISVSDNGKGIDKKYRKFIFQKFYRIPTGNVHDVKGFGIGLYYVKSICRLHKWKIKLESTFGKGSVFSIYIPLPR